MLITQQLSTVANQNRSRAAISFLGKDINFGEVAMRVARLSYLYQNELGMKPRVGFLTRGSPAVITTFFALTNIRATSVFLDPAKTDTELAEWMKDAEITHLAVTNDLLGRARDLLKNERLALPIVEIEKKQGGEYDKTFTPQPDKAPIDTDVILLLRTPGYSDKPKLVAFNHSQLHQAAIVLKRPYKLNATDRILTTMHWSHPFAWIHGVLLGILNGHTVTIHHGVDGKELLDFMVSAKVTRIVDQPKFFQRLLMFCKEFQWRLPGVRSVTLACGYVPATTVKIFGLMKIKALQCYGMTEAGWTISMSDVEKDFDEKGSDAKAGTSRSLPGFKYKVVDEQGDALEGKGPRTGNLAVSGSSLMVGYTGPQKKKEALEKATKHSLRGTWLYTQDLATLEEDGDDVKVTFLGRKAEATLIEGQYVIPSEIDDAVRGVAGVQEAAGFVTKSQLGKPILALAAVRMEGKTVNDKDLLDACKAALPAKLVPAFVTFTDALPKDWMGQVNRIKLSGQFSGIA